MIWALTRSSTSMSTKLIRMSSEYVVSSEEFDVSSMSSSKSSKKYNSFESHSVALSSHSHSESLQQLPMAKRSTIFKKAWKNTSNAKVRPPKWKPPSKPENKNQNQAVQTYDDSAIRRRNNTEELDDSSGEWVVAKTCAWGIIVAGLGFVVVVILREMFASD